MPKSQRTKVYFRMPQETLAAQALHDHYCSTKYSESRANYSTAAKRTVPYPPLRGACYSIWSSARPDSDGMGQYNFRWLFHGTPFLSGDAETAYSSAWYKHNPGKIICLSKWQIRTRVVAREILQMNHGQKPPAARRYEKNH